MPGQLPAGRATSLATLQGMAQWQALLVLAAETSASTDAMLCSKKQLSWPGQRLEVAAGPAEVVPTRESL